MTINNSVSNTPGSPFPSICLVLYPKIKIVMSVTLPSTANWVSPLCLGAMTFDTGHSKRYRHCTKANTCGIPGLFCSKSGSFIDTANNIGMDKIYREI